MIRPFIKWAGGKTRVLPDLRPHLPKGDCLIEPFVGGASVFLNTDYRRYVLADINPDLINLYRVAVADAELLIRDAQSMFMTGNTEREYLGRRAEFNFLRATGAGTALQLAVLFLYLNRHGFNGLCRYNQSGEFNVPFGRYRSPYFPANEIRLFAEKARDTEAIFRIATFSKTIACHASPDTVIYCDPPYLPISETANFTQYHTASFTAERHRSLSHALTCANRVFAVKCVISNSDTPETREIYQGFEFHEIAVQRSISANAITRGAAKEVIGLLTANCQESLPLLNGSTLRGLSTGFKGELRGMGL
ncbi:Dam family site-specific DNA-(adenine-N6)-methyltransferase [Pectobacterium aroidearum]|uniref:Dam family site-specific DNA-(adenine-N6)-methyltransferase n=1 Tax=Pectobacterium aroidearum TaxID=1201031 RepID=UPI002631A81F|nr:Dam family site-specific DNA-(adenine-N6)-methyltransferase [Pectobacterium aroidearum]WKA63677.1 Dam family site-specific DNA-(adenine-N6)-methyltransferase [Pectobacterium aroidearum]